MALNGASSKIFAILSKKNLNISAHDWFTSLIALVKINAFFGFCSRFITQSASFIAILSVLSIFWRMLLVGTSFVSKEICLRLNSSSNRRDI